MNETINREPEEQHNEIDTPLEENQSEKEFQLILESNI